MTIVNMFSYGFMQRAAIVGFLVALCAALLGVSLVLKRYSMIGDGLSHVGFGAMALGVALGQAPLYVAIPVVIAAAFLLLRISENSNIRGDAAIALISSSSVAVGLIVISLSGGVNIDISEWMFGTILSITTAEVYVCIAVSAVVLILYILCYNKIFAVTFDEKFAAATGLNTKLYNTLIALLTAMVIVVGMRMMGTLLISSLIIFPALTAMRVFKSFRGVMLCAACVSVIGVFAGLIASCLIPNLSPGAAIVVADLLLFLCFWGVGRLAGR